MQKLPTEVKFQRVMVDKGKVSGKKRYSYSGIVG